MKQITSITDQAMQELHIALDTGETIDILLRFMPAIQRWMLGVVSALVNIEGIIIGNHPNLLWSFGSVGKFGISCLSSDNVDPFQFDDFISGRSQLFILEESDLLSVEEFVLNYPEVL